MTDYEKIISEAKARAREIKKQEARRRKILLSVLPCLFVLGVAIPVLIFNPFTFSEKGTGDEGDKLGTNDEYEAYDMDMPATDIYEGLIDGSGYYSFGAVFVKDDDGTEILIPDYYDSKFIADSLIDENNKGSISKEEASYTVILEKDSKKHSYKFIIKDNILYVNGVKSKLSVSDVKRLDSILYNAKKGIFNAY